MQEMRKRILYEIKTGCRDFVIFPYGDIGSKVHRMIKDLFDIEPKAIVDSELYKYNPKIKSNEELVRYKKCKLILACKNRDCYREIYDYARNVFDENNIIEFCEMKLERSGPQTVTKIGKYSNGPICKPHQLIKSIGAFCNFAYGVDVVDNHEIDKITVNSMISLGSNIEDYTVDYNIFSYVPGWFDIGVGGG